MIVEILLMASWWCLMSLTRQQDLVLFRQKDDDALTSRTGDE